MEKIDDGVELIYRMIKGRFRDANKYGAQVKDIIATHFADVSKLHRTSVTTTMKQIRKDFHREEWPELKYMFKSIFVFIVNHHKPHLSMTDPAQLIEQYPEFEDADEVEKSLLLQFRNLMTVAFEIIPPKNHKMEILALIGRMCGAIYVTGGGQSIETDRRVLLYERETGITPRKLPIRLKRRSTSHTEIEFASAAHSHPSALTHTLPHPTSFEPGAGKRVCIDGPRLGSIESFWNYHHSREARQDSSIAYAPHERAFSSFPPENNVHPFMGMMPSHYGMQFDYDADPYGMSERPLPTMQPALPPSTMTPAPLAAPQALQHRHPHEQLYMHLMHPVHPPYPLPMPMQLPMQMPNQMYLPMNRGISDIPHNLGVSTAAHIPIPESLVAMPKAESNLQPKLELELEPEVDPHAQPQSIGWGTSNIMKELLPAVSSASAALPTRPTDAVTAAAIDAALAAGGDLGSPTDSMTSRAIGSTSYASTTARAGIPSDSAPEMSMSAVDTPGRPDGYSNGMRPTIYTQSFGTIF